MSEKRNGVPICEREEAEERGVGAAFNDIPVSPRYELRRQSK
jgi:hypothetical protein